MLQMYVIYIDYYMKSNNESNNINDWCGMIVNNLLNVYCSVAIYTVSVQSVWDRNKCGVKCLYSCDNLQKIVFYFGASPFFYLLLCFVKFLS
jgi:hypothetical protein